MNRLSLTCDIYELLNTKYLANIQKMYYTQSYQKWEMRRMEREAIQVLWNRMKLQLNEKQRRKRRFIHTRKRAKRAFNLFMMRA